MQRVEQYCRSAEPRFCPETIEIYNPNYYELQVLNFMYLHGAWNQSNFEHQIKEQLLAITMNCKEPVNVFLFWPDLSLLLLYVWNSTISAENKDYETLESFISYIKNKRYTPFRNTRYNTSLMTFDFYEDGKLKIYVDPIIERVHNNTLIDLYSDNLLTLAYDYIVALYQRLKEQSSQQVFPSNVG